MKNLANCTPREFLVQTNKIRKHVAKWLTLTRVLEIRKTPPVFTAGMTEEEKKQAVREQAKQNIQTMLDSIMEEHPEETAELLGLLCFIDPEDLDSHSMAELFGSVAELIGNQEVLDFFTSLASWEKIASSSTARA